MTRLLKSDNYPYGIGGLAFTLDEDTVSRSRAALTEDTPRHTIQRLVRELPTDKSLHFYDRYHPPWTDLGAFVAIRKRKGLYVHMLWSRGWSSPWRITSPELMAEYLFINRSANSDLASGRCLAVDERLFPFRPMSREEDVERALEPPHQSPGRKPVGYPCNVPGLHFTTKARRPLMAQLGPETSREAIERLLHELPPRTRLSFYDRFHPQWSDPGAYVSVVSRNGHYEYSLGNHGWSSRARVTSAELMAAYLYMNRAANSNLETGDWVQVTDVR